MDDERRYIGDGRVDTASSFSTPARGTLPSTPHARIELLHGLVSGFYESLGMLEDQLVEVLLPVSLKADEKATAEDSDNMDGDNSPLCNQLDELVARMSRAQRKLNTLSQRIQL